MARGDNRALMIQTPTLTAEPFVVTEREFEALPETNRKVEVVDGVIRVSPDPTVAHQIVMARLWAALDRSCPSELLAVPGTDVKLTKTAPLNVRSPDVLVIRKGAERMMPPSDVILAVEVISPSTRTQDRVHKANEYALAGIPNYWILDLEGRRITLAAGRLDEEAHQYQFGAVLTGEVHLTAPFPVDLDLDALIR